MATTTSHPAATQELRICIDNLARTFSVMTPDEFCAETEKTFSGKIRKSVSEQDRRQIFYNFLEAAVICKRFETDALFHFHDETHATHKRARAAKKGFLVSLDAVAGIYTGEPRFGSKRAAIAFELSWLPTLVEARKHSDSARPSTSKIGLARPLSKRDAQLKAA